MSQSLSSLRNLGPVSVAQLREVGIEDAEALRALGAVAAYRRVKHAFPRQVSLLMLYALAGAILDCHWNKLPPGMKQSLKSEVDG